jgi:hypothetical protein
MLLKTLPSSGPRSTGAGRKGEAGVPGVGVALGGRVAVAEITAVAVTTGVADGGGGVHVTVGVGVTLGKTIARMVGVAPLKIAGSWVGTSRGPTKLTAVVNPTAAIMIAISNSERYSCSLARSCSRENNVVRPSRRASDSVFAPTRTPSAQSM